MIPFAFATGNCGCPLALLRTDSFALPRACPSGTALRSVCTFPRCLVLRSFSQAFPRLFPLGRSLRRYRRYPVPQSLPALPEARSRSGACLPWVLRQLFAACSPDPPALCLRFHRVAPRSAIAHASQAPLASSAAWGKFPCPLNSALSFPSLVPSLGNFLPHCAAGSPSSATGGVNLCTLTTAQLRRVSLSLRLSCQSPHWSLLNQALGLLVPPSCTCYHASTDGLSTRSSPGGLTSF